MSLRKIPLPDIKKNVIKLFTQKRELALAEMLPGASAPSFSCSLHAWVMVIVTGQKTRHIL